MKTEETPVEPETKKQTKRLKKAKDLQTENIDFDSYVEKNREIQRKKKEEQAFHQEELGRFKVG